MRLAPQVSVKEPIYEKQRFASSQSAGTRARWQKSRMRHRSRGADRAPPPTPGRKRGKAPKGGQGAQCLPCSTAARSRGCTLCSSGAPHRAAVSQRRATAGATEAGSRGTWVRRVRDWRPRSAPLAAEAKKGPPPATRLRAPASRSLRARPRAAEGEGRLRARAPSSDAQTSLKSLN